MISLCRDRTRCARMWLACAYERYGAHHRHGLRNAGDAAGDCPPYLLWRRPGRRRPLAVRARCTARHPERKYAHLPAWYIEMVVNSFQTTRASARARCKYGEPPLPVRPTRSMDRALRGAQRAAGHSPCARAGLWRRRCASTILKRLDQSALLSAYRPVAMRITHPGCRP